MKRLIIYLLLVAFSFASAPNLQAADRDRGSTKSSAMKMKPKKLSKHTAKLRKERTKDRKKQMADIKKSNQQRNRSKR